MTAKPASNNITAVFVGTPDFAVRILDEMLQRGFRVPLVITQPDKPVGRGKIVQESQVAQRASAAGLPVIKPERIAAAISRIQSAKPDVLVVAAYGQILPKEVLAIPSKGSVNVHASLLPAYRGAAPVQQAILDGLDHTGVTIMLMDEGLDTGPVIATEAVTLDQDETSPSLSAKLAAAGARLLATCLPQFLDGDITPAPQRETGASYTTLISKADGRIDWAKPADYLIRQWRAFTPWPGCWSTLGSDQTVLSLASDPEPQQLAPGAFSGQAPLRVGTGTTSVLVPTIQPSGKNPMSGEDWLRGYRGTDRVFV